MAPQTTIFLGDGDVTRAFDAGMTLSNGTKSRDRTTTLYRLQPHTGGKVSVQLGKGLDKMHKCSIVQYKDDRDDSQKKMIFADFDDHKEAKDDYLELVQQIGRKLYDGREAYWGGRVPRDMSFDDFMAARHNAVKTNKVLGNDELLIKVRSQVELGDTKFYLLKDVKKDSKTGRFSCSRQPISRFADASTQTKALVCCTVGAYTGYNKGVTWGVFMTCNEIMVIPEERTASAAGGSTVGIDLGGMVDVRTEDATVTVTGGAAEEDAEELEEEEEEVRTPPKRKRTIAHISKKQTV